VALIKAKLASSHAGNTQANAFIAAFGKPFPGPLPLLGAGAAFGLSRKILRRIKFYGMPRPLSLPKN
jgi:hypothetical protein